MLARAAPRRLLQSRTPGSSMLQKRIDDRPSISRQALRDAQAI